MEYITIILSIIMPAPRFNPELYANRNSDRQGTWRDDQRIGEGKYKYVCQGEYDNGEPSACKFLKSGTTFSSNCFDDDVVAWHNLQQRLFRR